MSGLQDESRIETTKELIADWERVLLGKTTYGKTLEERRLLLKINSKKMANKRAGFNTEYAIRLQQVQIECCDALWIIGSRDTPETFFYLDPPYVGANQGHYDGYTQMDFDALLRALEDLTGKFLLSSFRNRSPGGMQPEEGLVYGGVSYGFRNDAWPGPDAPVQG
jgi:hypothetical protein